MKNLELLLLLDIPIALLFVLLICAFLGKE